MRWTNSPSARQVPWPALATEPVLDRAVRRGPGPVCGAAFSRCWDQGAGQPGTESAGEQLFTVLNRTVEPASVTESASL